MSRKKLMLCSWQLQTTCRPAADVVVRHFLSSSRVHVGSEAATASNFTQVASLMRTLASAKAERDEAFLKAEEAEGAVKELQRAIRQALKKKTSFPISVTPVFRTSIACFCSAYQRKLRCTKS